MKVTRIEWTYHTSTREGSGTDSPVRVEIFRDEQLLASVWEEPGETGRLAITQHVGTTGEAKAWGRRPAA